MDTLSYLLGKKSAGGGGETPKLQDKALTITENTTTTVTPDAGYDGLASVTITTNVDGGGGLPSDYTQVEYIKSSGTQYINTGVNANSKIKIDIVVVGYQATTAGILFGGGVGWQNNYIQGELDDYSYFAYGNNAAGFNFNPIAGVEYNIVQDKNKVYVDNVSKRTFTDATFSTEYPIYLFAYNRSGTTGENGTYKMKSCKIYDNNVLKRNFVPCFRNSDNEVGMYDLVSKAFYTNDGSGDFTYDL